MTMSGRPRCSATSNTVTTFGVRREARRRERLAPEARARVLVPRVAVESSLLPRPKRATTRAASRRGEIRPRTHVAAPDAVSTSWPTAVIYSKHDAKGRLPGRAKYLRAPISVTQAQRSRKPSPSGIVRVEREDVLAGAIGASLDLGDDRRDARDLGVADDAAAELGVDDAAVAKLVAARKPTRAVEEREPRRRSAAARRAVDLAVREHRDVALGQRALALLLPEDHAVDVAKLRLERVDDVLPRLELALELAAELDRAAAARPARPAPRARRRTRRRRRRPPCARRARPPRPRRTRARCGSAPSARGRPRPCAQVSSRPEGTSTTTWFSPSSRSTMPSSSAHVTSAIVPCPHAVE